MKPIKNDIHMCLSMHDFARLFLAKMADNSLSINFNQTKSKDAYIPFNYRERIENILCANNGWKEKFSVLIDMDEYFEDHFFWERLFAEELLNVVNELGKDFIFDIVSEHISVAFSAKEIKEILSKYDYSIVTIMDHFVNLIMDAIYSREFQEQHIDYTARSREKMHRLNVNGND